MPQRLVSRRTFSTYFPVHVLNVIVTEGFTENRGNRAPGGPRTWLDEVTWNEAVNEETSPGEPSGNTSRCNNFPQSPARFEPSSVWS